MKTDNIMTYVEEIETLDHFNDNDCDYLRYLLELEKSFKAEIFQCAAESSEFTKQLMIVYKRLQAAKNQLDHFIGVIQNLKKAKAAREGHPFKGLGLTVKVDMPDNGMSCAAVSVNRMIKYLENNYPTAIVEFAEEKPVPVQPIVEEEQEPVKVDESKPKEETKRYGLTAKEISTLFGLSYNKVKDRTWREENNFPSRQPGGKNSKVVFYEEEVRKWIDKHKS